VLGRGCVDDAEDADVIVHELAHAILHGCTEGFAAGDTGAIGEGFADYWAVAHSLRRPKGEAFHPEWVFTWNAHNPCLDGRSLDLDPAQVQYDPQRSYALTRRSRGGG